MVGRGQDDRPGQALLVLRHGKRGPVLRRLPGTFLALPSLQLLTEGTVVRRRRADLSGISAGAD